MNKKAVFFVALALAVFATIGFSADMSGDPVTDITVIKQEMVQALTKVNNRQFDNIYLHDANAVFFVTVGNSYYLIDTDFNEYISGKMNRVIITREFSGKTYNEKSKTIAYFTIGLDIVIGDTSRTMLDEQSMFKSWVDGKSTYLIADLFNEDKIRFSWIFNMR
jgi:hypothetical protein